MFCRRALQRVGPLARRAFEPTSRTVPVRHMAFGIPGGSTNMAYVVLCGGGLTAAVVYAYKTVNGDSERYEERLASMGSAAKAPEEAAPAAEVAAPEVTAPAAEPASVEEAPPAAEVVAELAPAPAEPVAETAAELVVEAVAEEAPAVAAEEVAEAAAEPAVTEEVTAVAEEVAAVAVEAAAAAAPEVVEAAPEVAPEEMPAEAPAAESTEFMPEQLTAVQTLACSTAEIAAASVVDTSLGEAFQIIEEDDKDLDPALATTQPDAQDATTKVEAEEATEEAAAVVNEEEPEPAADAEAPAAEEQIKEETATPVADAAEGKEADTCLLEELTIPAPTLEEQDKVEAEDQALVPEAAPEETVSFTDTSPEDSAPAEEAPTAEEAAIHAETALVDETATVTSLLEETPAEAPSEEAFEVVETSHESEVVPVNMIQLAAASSGSFLEAISASEPESAAEASAHEAEHCHSCHSAPSLSEEVAPPVVYGGLPAIEGCDDMLDETNVTESLVEGQTTETMVVVTAQS